MSSNYTLVDVRFGSSYVDSVLETEEIDGKEVVTRTKRVTKLNASVLYSVQGWDELGSCVASICDICEIEKDKDGNIDKYVQHSYPSKQEVLDAIDAEVQKKLLSNDLSNAEQSFITAYISSMNQNPDYPKDPTVNTNSPFIYPPGVEL